MAYRDDLEAAHLELSRTRASLMQARTELKEKRMPKKKPTVPLKVHYRALKRWVSNRGFPLLIIFLILILGAILYAMHYDNTHGPTNQQCQEAMERRQVPCVQGTILRSLGADTCSCILENGSEFSFLLR